MRGEANERNENAFSDARDEPALPKLPMLDVPNWTKLAADYKANDENREMVIKRCRDMQKLSKNAIFALHRGDMAGASKQIQSAESIAQQLLPAVSSGNLRLGSFAGACEEYAEARIFQVYLQEGRVLTWREASWLTCEEYLGGLMDFTGEVGRVAVAHATERNEEAVRRAMLLLDELDARFAVLDPKQPGLRKKLAVLEASASKVRRLVYELSLSSRNPLMGARLQAAEPAAPRGDQDMDAHPT